MSWCRVINSDISVTLCVCVRGHSSTLLQLLQHLASFFQQQHQHGPFSLFSALQQLSVLLCVLLLKKLNVHYLLFFHLRTEEVITLMIDVLMIVISDLGS